MVVMKEGGGHLNPTSGPYLTAKAIVLLCDGECTCDQIQTDVCKHIHTHIHIHKKKKGRKDRRKEEEERKEGNK